jgi:hypothetical protein
MRTHGKLMLGMVATGTLAMLTASPLAMAQDSDVQRFRLACDQDYKRYCTGDSPGPALEEACLSQYYINLSLNCRAALDRQQNATAADEDQSSSSDENSQ